MQCFKSFTSKGGTLMDTSALPNTCSRCLSLFSRACRMRARRNWERAATIAMCAGILVSISPTMNSTSQKRRILSNLPKSSCNVHLGYDENWKRYISAERILLSTVPPKMNIASPITAAAWKSRPGGTYIQHILLYVVRRNEKNRVSKKNTFAKHRLSTWLSVDGKITFHVCVSRS